MFEKFDVSLPVIKDIMFDIRDYGAVGDGVTSNTQMFKDAICAAAECGGRVLVPDGILNYCPAWSCIYRIMHL